MLACARSSTVVSVELHIPSSSITASGTVSMADLDATALSFEAIVYVHTPTTIYSSAVPKLCRTQSLDVQRLAQAWHAHV